MRFVIAVAACLCGDIPARADSLFQRLPEPGRWCRYQTIVLAVQEDSAVSMPEQRGKLTVSALNIVEHDSVPHQWIEMTYLFEVPTGNADEPVVTEALTYKCLVRRDQLQAGGEPLDHVARGWLLVPDHEAVESNGKSLSGESPEALILRFVMSGPLVDQSQISVPNSARIDEKEFETSDGLTGRLEPVELPDGVEISGEFSYWTHDAAGFGVLASEILLNTRRSLSENTVLTMQIAVQLAIEAAGDGAVSKLSDRE